MKKIFPNVFFFFLSEIVFSTIIGGSGKRISCESLLNEMVNRENITRFPAPAYTCKQFSSYDRATVSRDSAGWFANADRSMFLRSENNNGRRELVMFDADGPGAVVRFWITLSGYGGNGILRFYFDYEASPEIEGEVTRLISGGELAGYPLSASVSELSPYLQRGHNLYLPIPYSTHLKITYESASIVDPNSQRPGEKFYYNINYRTYPSGIEVVSFSKSDLVKYSSTIDNVLKKLKERNREVDTQISTITFAEKILPGEKVIKSFSGSNSIRKIQLKLKSANPEQALRSIVLEIIFDGERTVWCPAGDFFGTGYKISKSSTWYQEVTADGLMTSYWVMPFHKTCNISFINYGEEDIEITEGKIVTARYLWNKKSMYFGTSWFQNTHMKTRKDNKSGHDGQFDLNYTTLKGKGVYIGDGVTLFNPVKEWWGEGDEKIYIDNESFPSHIGTGTEDYYGYAWCKPEKFEHPFIAQPDGSGNSAAGFTVNMRYRALDAIPFNEKLQVDLELWHSANTILNIAPVTYWYIKPGGSCGINPSIGSVQEKVAGGRSEMFP